jgi:hypothetical protein
MFDAPSFESILTRADESRSNLDPTGKRLVSIIFANPGSPIWLDLTNNCAYLDARSGEKWDLFFAGMSVYASEHGESDAVQLPPLRNANLNRFFNPHIFHEVETAIRDGQSKALSTSNDDREPWRFSGKTDLVSFMVYDGEPEWLTLKSVELEMPLAELTEKLTDWETGNVDVTLAPGEFPYSGASLALPQALLWSANAIGAGVASNAVWELLVRLTHV